MNYQERRYQVVNGKILKNWGGDQDGWFKTKKEALDAVNPQKAELVKDARKTLTLKKDG